MTMTRRDMMKQTGMVAVVSAVAGSFADDLVVSADAAPLNAIAGVDRVVMRGGRTYLNGWAGYGEPPRRTRGAREAAPPAPADSGPPPATAWSKLSGPGDVQFADAKAAVTTATIAFLPTSFQASGTPRKVRSHAGVAAASRCAPVPRSRRGTRCSPVSSCGTLVMGVAPDAGGGVGGVMPPPTRDPRCFATARR